MSPAPIARRAVLSGAAAALGAVALPAGISRALAAEAALTGAAGVAPALFDPAAFVAELRAAGYGVSVIWGGTSLDLLDQPPTFAITPRPGQGFGAAYFAVMARWSDAMAACPDYVERVVAHAVERVRGS